MTFFRVLLACLISLLLAGCAVPNSDIHAQLRTFVANGGMAPLQALTSDLPELQAAARSGDFAQAGVACSKIATDVVNARSAPPWPDDTAQREWSSALDYYAKSAGECLDALRTDPVSDAEMTQAGSDIRAATTMLNAAARRIREITGQAEPP